MRKQFTLTTLAAATLMLLAASCKKGKVNTPDENLDAKISFTSSILGQANTKASGNTWDANDNIGVFSKKSSDGTSVDVNKKYTTTGNGNFTATGSEIISYPSDGSSLKFAAYYPYNATNTNNIYKVNVASQSSLPAIDLMYASNATGFSQTSTTTPNLTFTHQLSKVEITVKAGAGVSSVSGVTAAFQSFNTLADFDLIAGALTSGLAPANINANITASGADQLASAIMLPLADASNKTIVFTLPSGDNFTWTLPAGSKFEAGKKNTYTIVLQKVTTPVAVQLGTATITNWVDVPGGSTNLNPDVTTPTPTEKQIFMETFGTKDLSGFPSSRQAVTAYDNYDNPTFAYAGNTTIIVAGNGFTTNNARFVGTENNIKMNNINTDGFTNLKLQFRATLINAPATGTTLDFANIITVRYNGVDYTVPAAPSNNSTTPVSIEVNLSTAAANATSTLEFIGNKGIVAPATGSFFRIDDVKLLGTK